MDHESKGASTATSAAAGGPRAAPPAAAAPRVPKKAPTAKGAADDEESDVDMIDEEPVEAADDEGVESKTAADEALAGCTSVEQVLARTEELTARMTGAKEDVAGKKGAIAADQDGRHRGRRTEQEEDEELVTEALNDGNTPARVLVQPALVTGGEMRDYQLEGLNWLVGLHDRGVNGILADEMGLGKTLQSISLLAYLKGVRDVAGPHLVIVPKSTLGNWAREFKRWAPALRVLKLHAATKEERKRLVTEDLRAGEFDVCITSYEVVNIERASLRKKDWYYVIIDEAHRIKNEKSALSREVRTLPSKHRLLVTGTPLQNNLHELWALLNFLLPKMFANSEAFDALFDAASKDALQENFIHKLHRILRPFLLRRLKSDVETSLLPKRETKIYVGMTVIQQQWYTRILSKDAVALNSVGGPDRVRLLNILMQLRKVCNHPYLFDGAEPGPPYVNGPHIWEACGKMLMLEKLLPKLKEQGSRVLIFCQMTRMLDILEDYMAMKGYLYCRIDGSTSGELRDQAMLDFNAPDSPIFCFLLSTRAGGLGINLATADVVILYDSDWNPQMDLQAMDRAHRIGQKKQVRVFRFITEKSVEEKITERALRKLYLDAVVIQQGRLMDENKSLSKGELMTMVRFGADQIFRQKTSTVSTEDIDAILAQSEQRTAAESERLKSDMTNTLANFRLDGAVADQSIYLFDGEDFSKGGKHMSGAFINLPQRERKRNYDVDEYFREALRVSEKKEPREPRTKAITMHDFQFFDKERLEPLLVKEQECLAKRKQLQAALRDARSREAKEKKRLAKQMAADKIAAGMAEEEANQAAQAEIEKVDIDESRECTKLEEQIEEIALTRKEQTLKDQLQAEGFGSWTRRDFRAFVTACEKYGRDNKDAIFSEVAVLTERPESEVKNYFRVFWSRYKELADWQKLVDRVEKGEQRVARRQQIETELAEKVARHTQPFHTLSLNYGASKQSRVFTEEEDRFLVCMMHYLGYGAWEELRAEIRKAWQFRFDWYIKSRTAVELQRRCDTLIRLIEKENESLRKKDDDEASVSDDGGTPDKGASKRGRPPSAGKPVTSAAKRQRK